MNTRRDALLSAMQAALDFLHSGIERITFDEQVERLIELQCAIDDAIDSLATVHA